MRQNSTIVNQGKIVRLVIRFMWSLNHDGELVFPAFNFVRVRLEVEK